MVRCPSLCIVLRRFQDFGGLLLFLQGSPTETSFVLACLPDGAEGSSTGKWVDEQKPESEVQGQGCNVCSLELRLRSS